MKYLAIDYGSKHTGLAVSDTGGRVAMPHAIIPNNRQMLAQITQIITQESIDAVVIGESKDFNGLDNTIQSDINSFSKQLTELTGLSVHTTSELFSSKLAKQGTEHLIRFNPRNVDRRKLHKKEHRIDDKAATIMLQSFLDSQNN